MAASITFFNSIKKKFVDGTGLDLDNDVLKLALCSSTFVPNINTQIYYSDITNEFSGGGYTAGGEQVTGVIFSTASDRCAFDASNTEFTGLTVSNLRTGVLYSSESTAAASPLICYVDLGTNYNGTDATMTFSWHANGIGLIT